MQLGLVTQMAAQYSPKLAHNTAAARTRGLPPCFRPDSDTRSTGERRGRAAAAAWRRETSCAVRRTRRRAATASPSPFPLAPLLVLEAGASAPPLRSVHSPPNPYLSASCANANQASPASLPRRRSPPSLSSPPGTHPLPASPQNPLRERCRGEVSAASVLPIRLTPFDRSTFPFPENF